MVLAYMIPLSGQNANVQESLKILGDEGWYPTMPYVKEFTYDYGEYLDSPATLDNYTDELMITIATLDPQGKYLHAAMVDYCPRYWCGFVAVLRPVLFFLDYGEIRMLNILVQMFLVMVLALLLYKRKGKIWCFWVVSMYALLTPYCMGMSMQNSCVFYIGMLGAVGLLKGERVFEHKNRHLYLFFILGIITVYFDFLTYPLFTWSFPMLVWIVIKNHRKWTNYIKDVILTGICWGLGYVGMWTGKWIVASLVLKTDIASLLMGRIELHSIYGGTEITFLANLVRNLEKWVNIQTTCILLAWSIWFCVMLIKRKGSIQTNKCLSFTLIGCGSLAWLFVMRYHTFIHAFFTHRVYCTAFCAILAACICMIEEETDRKAVSRKVLIPVMIFFYACMIGITLQCKVDFHFHNGDQPPRHILLEEGSTVLETVVPRYNDIKGVEIGLIADGVEGTFSIEIYDQMECLYQEEVSFSEVLDGKMYPLNMELQTGSKDLTLCVTVKECGNANGYVYVTDGVFPLTECSEALMDGNGLGGQITHSFDYLALPGLKTCLNYFSIIFGVFVLLIADGYGIVLIVRQKFRERKGGIMLKE